jgi:hypothetical protein
MLHHTVLLKSVNGCGLSLQISAVPHVMGCSHVPHVMGCSHGKQAGTKWHPVARYNNDHILLTAENCKVQTLIQELSGEVHEWSQDVS